MITITITITIATTILLSGLLGSPRGVGDGGAARHTYVNQTDALYLILICRDPDMTNILGSSFALPYFNMHVSNWQVKHTSSDLHILVQSISSTPTLVYELAHVLTGANTSLIHAYVQLAAAS